MSRAKHPCAIDTCPEQIPSGFLMCRDHWYMVPRDLRNMLLAAYAESGGGMACLQHEEYMRLRERATAYVNGILTTRRKAAAPMDARPPGGRT